MEVRPQFVEKYPEKLPSELSKLIGSSWRTLNPDIKANYDRMAIEDRKRYYQQLIEREKIEREEGFREKGFENEGVEGVKEKEEEKEGVKENEEDKKNLLEQEIGKEGEKEEGGLKELKEKEGEKSGGVVMSDGVLFGNVVEVQEEDCVIQVEKGQQPKSISPENIWLSQNNVHNVCDLTDSPYQDTVDSIMCILPDFTRSQVLTALVSHNNNIENTINYLLNFSPNPNPNYNNINNNNNNLPIIVDPPDDSKNIIPNDPLILKRLLDLERENDEYKVQIEELEDRLNEMDTQSMEFKQVMIKKCEKYKSRVFTLTGGFGWKIYQKLQSKKREEEKTRLELECPLCYNEFSQTYPRFNLGCQCSQWKDICLPCYGRLPEKKCPFCG